MKKYIIIIVFILFVLSSFAQSNLTNSVLIRHDTTLLKATECEWIIKSFLKTDPTMASESEKPLPVILLQFIESGRLKAVDAVTGKPIPAGEIIKWRMPKDTIVSNDDAGNIRYEVHQQKIKSENLSQVRVYHDWYIVVSTGKIYSEMKCLELMEEVHSAAGYFIGYSPFCRIYY